jgi:hypothetical protein
MPTAKYELFELLGSVAVSDATSSICGVVDGDSVVYLLLRPIKQATLD